MTTEDARSDTDPSGGASSGGASSGGASPAGVDRNALGRAVAQRLRRPGRPGLARPVGLGLLAESSIRFAAGTARPTVVRRALAASATVAARSLGQAEVRPPRWWTPRVPDEAADADSGSSGRTAAGAAGHSSGSSGHSAPAAVSLPPRGLARAARQVPTDDQPRSPGTIAGGLVSTAIPVRRMEEVVVAGPMTSSHEQRRLQAPRPAPPPGSAAAGSSSAAGPPGKLTGGGDPTPARAASAGAVSQHSGAGIAAALRRSAARAAAAVRSPAAEPGAAGRQAGARQPASVTPTGRAMPGPSLSAPGPATALRRTLAVRRAQSEQSPVLNHPAAAAGSASTASAVRGGAANISSGPVRGGVAGSAAPAGPAAVRSGSAAGFLARQGSRVASVTAAVARRFAAPAAEPSGQFSGGQPSGGQPSAGQFSAGRPSAGQFSAGQFSAGRPSAGQSPAGLVAGVTAQGGSAISGAVLRRSAVSDSLPTASKESGTQPPAGRSSSIPASGVAASDGDESVSASAPPAGGSASDAGRPPAVAGGSPNGGGHVAPGSVAADRALPAALGSPLTGAATGQQIGSATGTVRRASAHRPAAPGGPLPSARAGMLRRAVAAPTPLTVAARTTTVRPVGLRPATPAAEAEHEQLPAQQGRSVAGASAQPASAAPAQRLETSGPAASVSRTSTGSMSPVGQPAAPGRPGSIRRAMADGRADSPAQGPGPISSDRQDTGSSLAGHGTSVAGAGGAPMQAAAQPGSSMPAGQPAARQPRHAAPDPATAADATPLAVPGTPVGSRITGRPLGLASLGRPIRRSAGLAGHAWAGTAGAVAASADRSPAMPGQSEFAPVTTGRPSGQLPAPLAALAPMPSAVGGGGLPTVRRSQLPSVLSRSGQLNPAVRPGRSVRPAWAAHGAAGTTVDPARPVPAPTGAAAGRVASGPHSSGATVATPPAEQRRPGSVTARPVAEPAPGPVRRSVAPPTAAARPATPAALPRSAPAGAGSAADTGTPQAGSGSSAGAPLRRPASAASPSAASPSVAVPSRSPAADLPAADSGLRTAAASARTWTPAANGRVLRAIVPGSAQAGSVPLPMARRQLSDQPVAGYQGGPQRQQQPVDAPIRRLAGGSVRPHQLPAPAARSATEPMAAVRRASATGRPAAEAPRPVAARSTGAAVGVGPARSAGGDPRAGSPGRGGAAGAGAWAGHATPTAATGTTATGNTAIGTAGIGAWRTTGRPAGGTATTGTPAVRRTVALPTTVRAAAAHRDQAQAGPEAPSTGRLPGALVATATGIIADSTGRGSAGQLGAFANRSMVVAPPRVSIRPAERAPAAAGPPVPDTARAAGRPTGTISRSTSAPSHGSSTSQSGIEMDGPVIRRSLSGTAHSLFRSLLRNPGPGGPGISSDPVQSGSTAMFEQFQHSHGMDGPSEPPVLRRFRESGGHSDATFNGHDTDDDSGSPAMRARDFDELIDRIVAKLEQRITDDLERRGRRHLPEVF